MSRFLHMHSLADLFQFFRINEKLQHPLVGIIDFGQVPQPVTTDVKISADFYCLLCKNYDLDNVRYGRKVVDFQNGSLICMAPNQVLEMSAEEEASTVMEGWGLFFHPDFIRTTSLHNKMKDYNFFSYEVSESLHLSEKEKAILNDCIAKIETELKGNIDVYSQAIVTSGIEWLLNYCTRFYGRQFITRKSSNHIVVTQVETIFREYFTEDGISEKGLPSVKSLADQVHLSPGYLSDLLKKETGKNTQDHIHFYLIEEAKNRLLNSDNAISEIAYQLGFEYPQYFNKLFKQKVGKTPVQFRNMN